MFNNYENRDGMPLDETNTSSMVKLQELDLNTKANREMLMLGKPNAGISLQDSLDSCLPEQLFLRGGGDREQKIHQCGNGKSDTLDENLLVAAIYEDDNAIMESHGAD